MANNNKLRMKDDIMFKAFFSRNENKKFLKDFISSILGENIKIKQVIHDARLEQLARERKYGILDLDVELESGELINIEMQLNDYKNMERRTTFYAAKKISEQEGIGTFYENLRKVIIISILDYNFIDLPQYITKTVRVAENYREYKLNNLVEYYYIELKKFREQNPDMSIKLNQWLAFIDGERSDLLKMAKEENKLVKEADKNYNVLTGDEEVKRLAEIRLLSAMEEHSALETAKQDGRNRGMKEGLEQGKKEGLEQGKKEGLEQGKKEGLEQGKKEGLEQGKKEGLKQEKIETARRMKQMNLDIKVISEATGLTEKEIKEIK